MIDTASSFPFARIALAAAVLWLAAIAASYAKLLIIAERPRSAEIVSLPSGDYGALSIKDPDSPLAWAETGRDEQLLSWVTGKELVSIELDRFEIGRHWAVTQEEAARGNVSWHVRTPDRGRIRLALRNPQLRTLIGANAVTVHLYLIDDGDRQRNLRLVSGKFEKIVSAMFPGKWVSVPLSEEQVANGIAVIEIHPLTGYGALLSAVALSVARPERNLQQQEQPR